MSAARCRCLLEEFTLGRKVTVPNDASLNHDLSPGGPPLPPPSDQWQYSIDKWKGTALWKTFPPGMENVPNGKPFKMTMEEVRATVWRARCASTGSGTASVLSCDVHSERIGHSLPSLPSRPLPYSLYPLPQVAKYKYALHLPGFYYAT